MNKLNNTYNSFSEIKSDLEAGIISCQSLVGHYLCNIEERKSLNAFLEVFSEEAMLRAADIDKKLKAGKAGKLAGMVLAIKDNICFKNHHCSASSKILKGFTSLYSATVIERLLAEDAIIIGRTNCDEFAMGSSNENSAYGNVLNAANESYVPGGSSGGSAVAVQADMCLAALGSDTGGSIRQPAALCGLFGFKPTYGRVSRHGLIAYASSFDQIGPICRSVNDVALITSVISGRDDYDATLSNQSPTLPYLKPLGDKFRIAVLKDCLEAEGLDAEIKLKLMQVIDKLKAAGHQVDSIEFPYLEYLIPTYYVLTTAEASSNLSRFAGIHYGYRSPNATDLESTYKKSRSEGFGTEVKRRIMLGTFVLSEGYYDAYYSKAQKVRRLLKNKTDEIFASYDFILLPTSPTTAFKLGEKADNPIALYLADIFTVHSNIVGIPALTIPVGSHSNGLPVGLQFMANMFEDDKLLGFAKSI